MDLSVNKGHTMAKLTIEQQLNSRLRNLDFFRKPSSFEELDNLPVEYITQEEVDSLEIADATELGIENPFCAHNMGNFMLFILNYNDQMYLVNSEGHDYCRYVVAVAIRN